ncbi:hypothetical protein NDU88_003130 [Pleurodeles waltl]|uniref:Uncharacterized protein n=1 Tax=Pleurodeles waltl TaxID=8319 RepID=A0AAV7NFT4_PLEWA|nr:hypothetical protein NDU88_003130 [Pleurodeles waltl]
MIEEALGVRPAQLYIQKHRRCYNRRRSSTGLAERHVGSLEGDEETVRGSGETPGFCGPLCGEELVVEGPLRNVSIGGCFFPHPPLRTLEGPSWGAWHGARGYSCPPVFLRMTSGPGQMTLGDAGAEVDPMEQD